MHFQFNSSVTYFLIYSGMGMGMATQLRGKSSRSLVGMGIAISAYGSGPEHHNLPNPETDPCPSLVSSLFELKHIISYFNSFIKIK